MSHSVSVQASDERGKYTAFDDVLRDLFATRDPLALVVSSLCRWVPSASTAAPLAGSFHLVFRTFLELVKLLAQLKQAFVETPADSSEPPLSATLAAVRFLNPHARLVPTGKTPGSGTDAYLCRSAHH